MGNYSVRAIFVTAGVAVLVLASIAMAGWWAGQVSATSGLRHEVAVAVSDLSPVVAALATAGLIGVVLMVALPGSRTSGMAPGRQPLLGRRHRPGRLDGTGRSTTRWSVNLF